MHNQVRLLGHAVHPMLIVFPLGLLATSVVFDAIYYSTGESQWTNVAYWMIVAGILGGLAAAVVGFIDWLGIPSGTRAKAIGLWHGATNFVVVLLFATSLFLRFTARQEQLAQGAGPFVLSLVGVALAAVGGWLGGELVERLGIGVWPDANPNAPSSLTTGEAGRTWPAGTQRKMPS